MPLSAPFKSMASRTLGVTAVISLLAIVAFWSINRGTNGKGRSGSPPHAESRSSAPKELNFQESEESRIKETARGKSDQYRWLVEAAATDGTQQAFDELAHRIPKENAARVREWLGESILIADFTKLGEVLNAMESMTERTAVIVGSIPRAVRSNKKAALAVIHRKLEGVERNNALRCAAIALTQDHQFSAAKEVVASMPPSVERTAAVVSLAYGLGSVDSVDALQWSDGLEGRERETALRWIEEVLRTEKHVDGLKSVLERTRNATSRGHIIKGIISYSLDLGDDAGATSFIGTLAGAERRNAEQHLSMRLAHRGSP